MELPTHPESDDDGRDPGTPRSTTWLRPVVIAVVVGLLAVVILLHATGVLGP